ncbi:hypothetical protein LX15_004202 [Streptoalloteichus tenebrarius]|uniref:YbaB/EbfC DNA-binding family protein n=1 Tax=Streptoalloteichus tenebrarius (strain ATCC 17920 / DSM 40477 / JCM 4838 / CBS 697.72 / NBRC 16177 / NCIMB 11028 / NRRL B-12390 / A12253. 1 / ISP 5477) TaxID=1933 RepID=A0ABT1HY90_STRSD|nr:hypothetical protein [Streptoalloteichus tenebrarius]MCP2260484.1 hypothetical protein [Streptoalloteichus tenebrarius]BFF02720.1 hypothetical protein GCM10020241_43950 [Streptoalloteichus tenebrarius]
MSPSPGGDEDLERRLGAVCGRAGNADGSVRVTATAHGALADLRLDRRAFELGPERLGAEIVRLTARAAADALRAELAELARLLPEPPCDRPVRTVDVEADDGSPAAGSTDAARRHPPRAS